MNYSQKIFGEKVLFVSKKLDDFWNAMIKAENIIFCRDLKN